MKRLLTVFAAGAVVAAGLTIPAVASASAGTATATPQGCRNFAVKAPAGTAVESVTAVAHAAGTVDVPAIFPQPAVQVPGVPAFCAMTVTLTHPGAHDHAKVQVWLPQQRWNGRLETVGGSAYAAGDYGAALAAAVKGGYAAATTDAGVGIYLDARWGLNSKGQVNKALLENFASRSEHEAAVVAKEVIDGFYAKRAAYAYFNGCSTGGRQGYQEAESYPHDYNGILANAPAIYWPQFEVATLWPQVVMNQEKTYPTSCEFNAFNAAAVKACDGLDGVKDGIVSDPARCNYDPRKLIGTTVDCDGAKVTITAADANVVRKIWDGPRTTSGKKLWYGVPIGGPLGFPFLAGTLPGPGGKPVGAPFPVPASWVSTWVEKQPSFDLSKVTYSQFAEIFQKSVAEYDRTIGSDSTNLKAFRAAGGKLLTWHGSADQLIPTGGTVQYRQQVARKMGGNAKVDSFYRLFLAPGTVHCGLNGQTDDLGALRAWVEHGQAPQTLPATLTNASGQTVHRDLCRYPLVSRYSGHGNPADASSFRCVTEPRG